MTDAEKKELHTECWKVVTRVNAMIAGIEENERRKTNVDTQEAKNALINITNSVIDLGKKFGVSV